MSWKRLKEQRHHGKNTKSNIPKGSLLIHCWQRREDLYKTHQVSFGHVLIFRAVVCCRFAEAVFGGCPGRLSVLSVRGALRSPAEQTDGFPNTSLDVNFCTEKGGWHKNMNSWLARAGDMDAVVLCLKTHVSRWQCLSCLVPQVLVLHLSIFISVILQLQNISKDFVISSDLHFQICIGFCDVLVEFHYIVLTPP